MITTREHPAKDNPERRKHTHKTYLSTFRGLWDARSNVRESVCHARRCSWREAPFAMIQEHTAKETITTTVCLAAKTISSRAGTTKINTSPPRTFPRQRARARDWTGRPAPLPVETKNGPGARTGDVCVGVMLFSRHETLPVEEQMHNHCQQAR